MMNTGPLFALLCSTAAVFVRTRVRLTEKQLTYFAHIYYSGVCTAVPNN